MTTRDQYVMPRVNIVERPETVVLEVELPGVPKENVDLEVKAGELTIAGRRKSTAPEGRLCIDERPKTEYRRVFTLSNAIDTSKIDASMDSGVLTVTLHKAEAMKPRHVAIH